MIEGRKSTGSGVGRVNPLAIIVFFLALIRPGVKSCFHDAVAGALSSLAGQCFSRFSVQFELGIASVS